MRVEVFIFGVIISLVSGSAARSADIDVFRLLSDRTAPYIAKQVAEICSRPFMSCFGVRFRNVHLIPIKVDYSDVHPDALPVEVLQQKFVFRNCSASQRTDQRSTTLQYTEGYTITKKDTVSNTMGEKVGFDIYGVQIGVTNQEKVEFSTQDAINKQTVRTENVVIVEPILPYTDLNITIQKKIGRAYLDFSGTVEISADVVMDMSGGAHGWDYPIARLSDVLPNRQFVLTGQIWNGRAESTQKVIQETKYTEANCPKGDPPPATLFAPVSE